MGTNQSNALNESESVFDQSEKDANAVEASADFGVELNLSDAGLVIAEAFAETSVSADDVAYSVTDDEMAAPDAGPTDNQWHLQSNTGYDMNVQTVWQDYTGNGVTVGVVDDGIQANHHELSGNYDASIDYDFNANTSNVTQYVRHGTAVAGVIAAANNGTGTTGVAYDATITSFKLLGGGGISLADVQGAFSQDVDISNNSWGWTQPFAAHSMTSGIESTLQTSVTNNRGGLGTVFIMSAGNDGDINDNANFSEMKNSRFTATIGATNENGTLTSFSTPGTPVLVSAPGAAVYTSDVTGGGGYAAGDYASMYGTSFSAPAVSGVVALMLEANSGLGYRDVQEILSYSAVQTDAGDAMWEYNGAENWNGGGMHVNEGFGYGLVDATAAVRLAETWFAIDNTANVFSNEISQTYNSAAINQTFDNTTVQSIINVGGAIDIEHVEVVLNMSHAYSNDLTITLTSADGTESILFDRPPTSNDYGAINQTYQSNWSLSSTHHWGELGAGNWTLAVTDNAAGNSTTLNSWQLRLYGNAIDTDDTYVYTNEYANFTGGANAARRSLSDSNAGNDTINAATVSTNSTINLNAGETSTIAGNTLVIANGNNIENAIGGDGADTITGNALSNTLMGGRGNDTLDGGAGIDTLIGGRGDDTYYVDSLSDVIIEQANEGYDIVYSTLADYVLSAHVEELQLVNNAHNVTGTENGEILSGNSNDNVMNGMGGNDTLYGGGGEDTLNGGEGNDFLDGQAGNDTMSGGAGDDVYVLSSNSDVIIENVDEGSDTVLADFSFSLADNVERLRLQGSGDHAGSGNTADNVLIGNSGNNLLDGKAGNDYLDGGLGVDTMIGGNGDDTYVLDSASDIIQEVSSAGGNDTVITTFGYTLGNNLENLRMNGSAHGDSSGNALNNQIYGSSGDNTIRGFGGNDYIDGGNGHDTLLGGIGDDVYYIHNATSDIIIENVGEGTDTALSDVTYTMVNNLENLRLQGSGNIGGTGNDLNNNIYGNGGANVLNGGNGHDLLDGGGGIDTLAGGMGDDSYYVDTANDVVNEVAGQGEDTIYATANYTLSANVENMRLIGSSNINGTGNADVNVMTGNSGNNILDGGAGNDVLDGGLGTDTLIGGTGDDWYYIRNSADVITENVGEGDVDYAFTYVDYVLGDNVERLRMFGSSHLEGTGNAGNNALYGNYGNNVLNGLDGNDFLDGGAGGDTMLGGIGDDTYVVDSVLDTVTENAAEGTDTVLSHANYTLGDNLERLRLQGSANLNGTGNSENNILVGNSGDNVLTGGAGDDGLTGGAGADTFAFSIGSGADLIGDFLNGTDLIDVSGWNITDFNDLIITEVNGDTRITHDAGSADLVTIDNVANVDIDAGDFIFA